MGIVNVTPDSFYDGGRYQRLDAALQHALALIKAGADLIDIGGESSRPGAQKITSGEELDRVLPLVEKLRQESDCAISVDTTKPEVMRAAVAANTVLINDINAFQEDGAFNAVAQASCALCIMHMQGHPATMQINPYYDDPIVEINQFFTNRINACLAAGIHAQRIILDPGFGFGKTVAHNLLIVNKLQQFYQHGRPLLLGVSRKSTIGALLNKQADQRLAGSLALTVYAVQKGLDIIRTHDVCETKDALLVIEALLQSVHENEETT